METKGRRKIMVAVCALMAGLSAVAPAKVIYVDDDAIGADDGSSWANAFTYLQDALALEGDEIRVGQGLYRPDQGVGITTGDPEATFKMPRGIVLRGGYAGAGSVDPNARSIGLYETILSGDLNGDDPSVQDAGALAGAPRREDNSLHVVTIEQVDFCVLDGFVIRDGHALDGGGGLRIEDSSPAVWNCTFTRNWAPMGGAVFIPRGNEETPSRVNIHHCRFTVNSSMDYGGGLCIEDGSLLLTDCEFTANTSPKGGGVSSGLADVTLSGCTFRANGAVDGGGLHHVNGNLHVIGCAFVENSALPPKPVSYVHAEGGAMLVSSGSRMEAVATDCLFRNNRASFGGAIRGDLTTLRGCRFTGNVAYERAGAIEGVGTLTCENCLFDGNQAMDNTAVVRCYGMLLFSNCTFVDNRSPDGNAFKAFGVHGLRMDNVFTNCIVWGAPHGLNPERAWLGKTSVTYSDVQGGYPGTGNIDADPGFVDPGHWDPNGTIHDWTDDVWVEGDYHLKSRAGRWDPAAQTWVQDEVTSPCIDAGDPNSPIGCEPLPNGGIINMGVYGGTAEAGKSYVQNP